MNNMTFLGSKGFVRLDIRFKDKSMMKKTLFVNHGAGVVEHFEHWKILRLIVKQIFIRWGIYMIQWVSNVTLFSTMTKKFMGF